MSTTTQVSRTPTTATYIIHNEADFANVTALWKAEEQAIIDFKDQAALSSKKRTAMKEAIRDYMAQHAVSHVDMGTGIVEFVIRTCKAPVKADVKKKRAIQYFNNDKAAYQAFLDYVNATEEVTKTSVKFNESSVNKHQRMERFKGSDTPASTPYGH